MKPALHRSITFWSGLLVMTFISWAWWDSMDHRSSADWGKLSGANFQGDVYVEYHPGDHFPAAARRDAHPRREDDPPPQLGSPAFLRGGGLQNLLDYLHEFGGTNTYRGTQELFLRYRSLEVRLLILPHWTLLLPVAGLWLPLLLWRIRRRKRTITP